MMYIIYFILLVLWIINIKKEKKINKISSKYETFYQVKQNILKIKQNTGTTNFGLVVKDFYGVIKYLNNRYGSNTKYELIKYLENDIDWVFFANINEGVDLRKYNFKKPIMILYLTEPYQIQLSQKYILDIVIPSLNWYNIAKKYININSNKIRTHLWFDSNLGKEGVNTWDELKTLYDKLKNEKMIDLVGLGTKYNTKYTSKNYNIIPSDIIKQHKKFKKIIKDINNPQLKIHVACSYEISSQFKDSYFDIIRIGSLAYRNIQWEQNILDIKIKKSNDCFGYYCIDTNDTKPIKKIKIGLVKNLARPLFSQKSFIRVFTQDGTELKIMLFNYDPFIVIIPDNIDLKINSKIIIKYNDTFTPLH